MTFEDRVRAALAGAGIPPDSMSDEDFRSLVAHLQIKEQEERIAQLEAARDMYRENLARVQRHLHYEVTHRHGEHDDK